MKLAQHRFQLTHSDLYNPTSLPYDGIDKYITEASRNSNDESDQVIDQVIRRLICSSDYAFLPLSPFFFSSQWQSSHHPIVLMPLQPLYKVLALERRATVFRLSWLRLKVDTINKRISVKIAPQPRIYAKSSIILLPIKYSLVFTGRPTDMHCLVPQTSMSRRSSQILGLAFLAPSFVLSLSSRVATQTNDHPYNSIMGSNSLQLETRFYQFTTRSNVQVEP